MPPFVFDTDTLSLYQRGHEPVVERFLFTHPTRRAVTVISVEEQRTGWLSLVRRARTPTQLALAYQSLTDTVSFLATMHVLSFTEPAIARYHALRAMKLGVGTMDLADRRYRAGRGRDRRHPEPARLRARSRFGLRELG